MRLYSTAADKSDNSRGYKELIFNVLRRTAAWATGNFVYIHGREELGVICPAAVRWKLMRGWKGWKGTIHKTSILRSFFFEVYDFFLRRYILTIAPRFASRYFDKIFHSSWVTPSRLAFKLRTARKEVIVMHISTLHIITLALTEIFPEMSLSQVFLKFLRIAFIFVSQRCYFLLMRLRAVLRQDVPSRIILITDYVFT